MKNLLSLLTLTFIVLLSSQVNSQEQRKTIAKGEVVDWKLTEVTKGEDTSIYFVWFYQNLEYRHITDLGSLSAFSKKDLEKIINALVEVVSKNDVSYKIKTGMNTIECYEESKAIFITDYKKKYTTLNRTQALALAEELKLILPLFDKYE
jgi:hypothetical protein